MIRPASADDIDDLISIDDDAAHLYGEHGLRVELAPEHPFCRAERLRWHRSAQLGRAFLAVDARGTGVAFCSLDVLDGEPYLDQLAVRVSAMRRGLGRALLERAIEWSLGAGGSALWLTTYDHLPFNRPYYERYGFIVVPESSCNAGVLHHLEEQRRTLPAPADRVAMRRTLSR
ncbi:MAG TPA: GNAT family N-acetyltransferase [Polyangiaceae bacterium]